MLKIPVTFDEFFSGQKKLVLEKNIFGLWITIIILLQVLYTSRYWLKATAEYVMIALYVATSAAVHNALPLDFSDENDTCSWHLHSFVI